MLSCGLEGSSGYRWCDLRNFLSLLACLLLLVANLSNPAQADKCPAASFVMRASEAYDHAAASASPAAFANAAARFSDIHALSMFALGRFRKDLPKNREAEYVALTRQFIGSTLKKHGSGFRGTTLTITDCTSASGGIVVSARTSSGARIVFRLARAGGSFTVKDVNMKGIWLAQQMRSTFVGTIDRTGSIDGLFAYLSK